MTECLSRFTLVRFHKKDVSAESLKDIQAHVGSCPTCQGILDEITANEATYNEQLDSHTSRLLDAIASEAAPSSQGESNVVRLNSARKKHGAVNYIIPVAAAAAMVLALYFLPQFKSSPTQDLGYKGSFSAAVLAQRGAEQFAVENQTTLYENDALRFKIQTSADGFLYIFNVDNAGAVTGLYPFDPNPNSQGLKIAHPGEHLLDDSVVLDNSKGLEHLVVIFAPSPLNIGTINGQAKNIVTQNALPKELGSAKLKVFTIEKK